MFQLLIVDDEREIREGLYNLSWGDLKVEAMGCCSHGLEALQFLQSNPVDIVMTDIRMPFMDGIELMEVLNRQYPFIHVIVLSAYNEFEYARKAMQSGAVDYLLKPIVFDDMVSSIKKLTSRLEEQKQVEQRMTFLQFKVRQLSRMLREKFLNELFHAPLSAGELEQFGAEGEVLLENDAHTAAVLRLDRFTSQQPPFTKKEMDLIFFSLDNILTNTWDAPGQNYHLVNRNSMETYLLSKGYPDQGNYENLMRQLLQYKGLFKSTFTIVAGMTVPGPGHIHMSLKAALNKIADNAPNTIFLCPRERETWNNIPANDILTHAEDDVVVENNADSLIIAQAKQYIKNNYNRSITLREVAEHVYISPGHLSALFKMNGDTFLRYLTDIRMKYARELMSDLKYNIYQIVEKVGYSDPAYFSELFKKHAGMTPNEYRKRLKLPLYS